MIINWKLHIKQIELKLSNVFGVLYKLRNLVAKIPLKSLFSSYIQSHVLYGILNWSCAKKTILEPLKRNLHKAVRVIDFANYTAHIEPIFKCLKIFNIDNTYMLKTAKVIFQINHNTSKRILQDEFVKAKYMHKYNTRLSLSEGFFHPPVSINFKKSFLTSEGIKSWKSLHTELKKIYNKHHFVRQMKYFLSNNF